MKKFLAIGLTTLSAATFVLGVGTAQASPSDPVVPDVCADLPSTILNSNNAAAAALATRDAADADLSSKRDALDSAVVDYVTAFANHLVELDKVDGTPAATQAILDAASAKVSEKVTPWGNAKIAQWNAQHNLDIANVVKLMNDTLQGTLPCA